MNLQTLNCPFCAPNIEDIAFIQNELFLGIYNASPILPGHSLVIPKKHVASLFELNDNEMKEFMSLAQKTARLLAKVFETDSFNWSIQERPAAGQSVPHLHMHVMPRKNGDLKYPGEWHVKLNEEFYSSNIDSRNRPKLSTEEIIAVVSQLKKFNN